jgi:acyl carrier protein
LQLILFIEREFDLMIENVPGTIDSFRTVNSIAELVTRQTRLAYGSCQ